MDSGVPEIESSVQALETNNCGDTSAQQANAPWAQRGGCPTRAGRSSSYGSLTGSKNWAIDTLGDVRSSAAVMADGSVIIGSDTGILYKINGSTGAVVKTLSLGFLSPMRTTPAIGSDGTVYVTGENKKLVAINPSTFAQKWAYTTAGAISSSPVIGVGGVIYFGSADKSVYAINSTGTKKWSYVTGGSVTSSPSLSLDSATIYVGSADTYLYALNTSNGTLKWKTKLPAAVSSSPAVGRFGKVFVGSADKLYALDTSTGAIVWQKSLGSCTVYSPAIADSGVIYVGTSFSALTGGSLYALTPDGAVLWQYDTFGGVESTPVIDKASNIFVGSNDGSIYGLNSAGKQIWKYQSLGGVRSSPAITASGALIFGSDDNWIYSVGTGVPLVPVGGVCASDAACEPGLICGTGNGDRFGKAAGTNVCWLPACENKVKDPTETEVDCGGPCGTCTNVCSQACTLGSQVTPPALEVLSFSKGSFIRGSLATYQVGANKVAPARGDQLRYEDRGDGNGRVALFEGARTNRVVYSEEMGHLPEWWVPPVCSPMMSLTENGATAPDGTPSAERWVAPAGAMPTRTQTILGPIGESSLSAWLKLTNSGDYNGTNPPKTRATLTDLTGGWYNQAVDWELYSAWERRSMVTTAASCATALSLSHKGSWPGSATQFPELGAADFAVWGWQLEDGRFPSSYIVTTDAAVTRRADKLVFEAKDVPSWVKSGVWQFDVLPLFGSDDLAVGDEYALVAWDGGQISLIKDANGAALRISAGTVAAAQTLTWRAHRKMTVTVDASARTLTVRGAKSGDGSRAFGSMAVGGTGRLSVGSLVDGSKAAFARMSEIRRVSAAATSCVSDPDCSYCGDGRVSGSEVCDTALDAHCNENCTEKTVTIAHSPQDCPEGQVFVSNTGGVFGLPASADICWPASCPANCGTRESPCGECRTPPNCAGKVCGGDRSDGRGGYCEGVCSVDQPGCLRDSDCPRDYFCAEGEGARKGKPAGSNICLPIKCSDYMPSRLDCGTTASDCGLCPALPNECGARVCGTDQYGNACGSCAADQVCNAQGQCIAPVVFESPSDPEIVAALSSVETAPVGTLEGSFAVTDAGTATYRIPISVPPGKGGLQPNLALSYDSGDGDGFLTKGWSLTGLSVITRCARTFAQDGDPQGVSLTHDDRFCLDGQRLVAVSNQPEALHRLYGQDGTEYRTELDSFVRVVSFGTPYVPEGTIQKYRGPQHFKAWTKDGRVFTYGLSADARVRAKVRNDAMYSYDEGVTASWLLEKVEDRHGNAMTVTYEKFSLGYKNGRIANSGGNFRFTTEIRPRFISYGASGSHEVEILYDDRPQTSQVPKFAWMPRAFTSGIGRYFSQPIYEIRTSVQRAPERGRPGFRERVQTYKLKTDLKGEEWKLTSVTQCAHQEGIETCHPPTTFEYEDEVPIRSVGITSDKLGGPIEVSYRGDDGGLINECDRDHFPEELENYFAVPMNLDGDPYGDLLNSHPTGFATNECDYYRPIQGLEVREAEALGDDDRAFKAPVSTVKFDEAVDRNRAWLQLFLHAYAGSPLASAYAVEDPEFDGREKLYFDHASDHPDLDGDGQKDSLHCENYFDQNFALHTLSEGEWQFQLRTTPPTSTDPTGGWSALRTQYLLEDCNFISTDFDGDGGDDILAVDDSGGAPELYLLFWNRSADSPGGSIEKRSLGSPGWIFDQEDLRTSPSLRFLDANGDGLLDVVHHSDPESKDPKTPMTLYLGTGREFVRYRDFSTDRFFSDEETLFEQSFIWDHDGDGRDELFIPSDRDGDANDRWSMVEVMTPSVVSGGRRSITRIPYRKVHYEPNDEDEWTTIYGWQRPTVLDWDGNGVGDLLLRAYPPGREENHASAQDPVAEIWTGGARRSGLLKKVVDGFSRVTAIEYSDDPRTGVYTRGSDCRYPQRCLPKLSHPVVSAHETAGQVGASVSNPQAPAVARKRFEYRYEDARNDVRGRGWLGFRRRSVREVGTGFPGSSVSETVYEYDLEKEFEPMRLFFEAGRPSTVISRQFSTQRNGTLVTNETVQKFTYGIHRNSDDVICGANVPWVELRDSNATTTSNGVLVSSQYTAFAYDCYGNPTFQGTIADDGRAEVVLTTYAGPNHPEWQALLSKWLVGLPQTVERLGADDARKDAAQQDVKQSKLVNTWDAAGNLTKVERLRGSSVEQTTEHSYENGNLISTSRSGRNATTQTTTVEYDKSGLFPISEYTAVHTEHGMAATKVGHDHRTGQPRYRKEPDGSWQVWNYDAFGRLAQTVRSNGTMSEVIRTWGTRVGSQMKVVARGDGEPETETELNAFGATIFSKNVDFQGTTSVVERFYDGRGRLSMETAPRLEQDAVPAAHFYSYDELDRVVVGRHPFVGSNGQVSYVSTVRDYLTRGARGSYNFDWEGYPSAVSVVVTYDEIGATTAQVANARGETLATIDAYGEANKFTYGAFGYLKKRAFLNSSTSFDTDEVGQVTRIVDPSSGVHEYVRDGLGLVQQYLHNYAPSTYDYDGLGRLVSATTPDGTYAWTWDGPASDPTGHLRLNSESITSAKVGNATTTYLYHGNAGALSNIQRKIEGEDFETLIESDSRGRPEIVHLPQATGQVIQYKYDARGRVSEVSNGNGTQYWSLVKIDAYGNDAVTKVYGGAGTNAMLEVGRVVEPATGLLAATAAQSTGAGLVQLETYSYDPRGLLASRSEAVSGVSESYVHDVMGRIARVTSGGVTTRYVYDSHGNLTEKPGVGSIHYDEAAYPYRVTSTDGSGTFTYDNLGNGTQVERAGPTVAGGKQKIEYSAFDLPTSVETGTVSPTVTKFRYDASNSRTVEEVGGTRTVYVGDAYRRVRKPGSPDEHVVRIPTPDGVVAEMSIGSGTPKIRSVLTDNLGSTSKVLDSESSTESRRYEPFGKFTSSSTASSVKAGFTGHEHDTALGLINMRGRMYDPAIGRFLTPDPVVQSPGNAQSWNGYSYVMNSPLNAVDPTGFYGEDVNPLTGATEGGGFTPPPVAPSVPTGGQASGALAQPLSAEESFADGKTLGLAQLAIVPNTQQPSVYSGNWVETPDVFGPAIAQASAFASGLATGLASGAAATLAISGTLGTVGALTAGTAMAGLAPALAVGLAVVGTAYFATTIAMNVSAIADTVGRITSGQASADDWRNVGNSIGSFGGGFTGSWGAAAGRALGGAVRSGLGNVLAATMPLVRRVPNPFGRHGSPAHHGRVLEAERRLNDMGFETVSGGSLPERAVSVGSGRRRFPDLVTRNADGKTVVIQVGRTTQGGSPVSREVRALNDLRNSGEFDHVFFIQY